MVDLTRVGDEDVEKIFLIIQGLKDGLSGGFQDNALYQEAVDIQLDCLAVLSKGSDNIPRVRELTEIIKYDILDI